jgi:hypothetical protein
MKSLLIAVLSLQLLSGCQAIRDSVAPPGEMGSNGKVNKCNDWSTNPQACGEARYNAPRVAKINLGQSISEVRQIMGRDPEQRSLKEEGGHAIEEWQYLTNYKESIVSVITFRNSKVVSLESKRR